MTPAEEEETPFVWENQIVPPRGRAVWFLRYTLVSILPHERVFYVGPILEDESFYVHPWGRSQIDKISPILRSKSNNTYTIPCLPIR